MTSIRTLLSTGSLVALLGAPLARLAGQGPDEHEGADFQRRRRAWFEDQRAYPNAEVNWEAIALARRAVQRTGLMSAAPMANAVSGNWIPMGPSGFFGAGYWGSGSQLDAGRVDAIALNPNAPGSMLIVSPEGGIWSTSTGGAAWTPVSDTQCSLQMAAVTFDPVNPSIAYAVTQYSGSAAGCAIMRSTDGGATWGSFNGNLNFAAFGGFGNLIFVDPATAGSASNTTLFYAYGGGGIYRSATSGSTWSQRLTFGYVTSIVAAPGRPGVFFAGVADYATSTSNRGGLYRSNDNGQTWAMVTSATSALANNGRLSLAVSPAQPNSVWLLASAKNSDFLSLSRWDDASSQLVDLAPAGLDLTQNGRTHFGSQGTYDLVLNVDPLNQQRIYIAGVRAFRSIDGGVNFAPMATEIHCDWHTLVIDPRNARQLWAGTDGGIFSSTDGGDTWLSRNGGLVISMYYPGVSQHPTDPSIILGGLQDNGSLVSNGTAWFNSVMSGDGGFQAINPSNPNVMWSTCQWSNGPCIQRRSATATGATFSNVSTGITTTDRAQFIPPLVMDPVTPTTLYYGTHRLYRTTNDGTLWTAISGDLTKGTGSIKAIAIAPTDALTIYVGTSDGNVQVSRDGGATYTLSTGLPNRAVTAFAIDRKDPTHAVVTFSGNGTPHVWMTTTAGLTWTTASGNLQDAPITAATMIDDGTNHFFVGSDIGVFESTDAGLSWSNTPFGMPNVVVNDLSYNPATKQLVAATWGRGLYRFSLANAAAVLRGDVNQDGSVNALDALLIQQALVGIPLPNNQLILPRGDTNCNGTLEAADALITLRAAVGLPTTGACVGTMK